MLRTDLLLGDYESVTPVHRWTTGELLRMQGRKTGAALIYVPESDERGRREREVTTILHFPGVPECRRTIETRDRPSALILYEAELAAPLAQVNDLPAPTLRAGLAALLSVVNFAHSRGLIHGHIDRTTILADPSGRFWITGWADAKPASETVPVPGMLSDVANDLRDLGCAFREALLRRPWPDPEGAKLHERNARKPAGQELIEAGAKVDRDFARVLSRMVTCDPREAYAGATDVLSDMGAVDVGAFDPWSAVPPIKVRRDVSRVLRLLENTKVPSSESVMHAASVEFVGPSGSGKSRLLAEIARAARARGAIVLTADGGAGGPWGGVTTLVRQLVQLVGRRSRACTQHEDSLRHLLGDLDPATPLEPRPQDLGSLEGRDTLTSAFTAALTDLTRIAFRGTPGMLLLDDEDRLPAAAHQVWRSAGQFVQAVNGDGGVLRALLVSASTRTYPAELGADRVVVPIREWKQRDVERYLARVFASPGGARDAAVSIFRAAGARPIDVVGFLRELERAGALAREGLRWRFTAPLSTLPPAPGGTTDHVRRALESCSRDAAAISEAVAVARELPLPRSVLGDLCDVRGPRLAIAADAAVAAGLLVVTGTSWRARTDAVAHRVYAAIPDDRRRILHREILNHLLDTSPEAIDPIATHARASADPRAEAWTLEAIAEARKKGAWESALVHAIDGATVYSDLGLQLDLRLVQAEMMIMLGRLNEAISFLDETGSRSPSLGQPTTPATLLLAHALYQARNWTRVSTLDLFSADAHDYHRAELRYLRAAAYRHAGKSATARREARLAHAELEAPPPAPVHLARLEFEYQCAFYEENWTGVHAALLAKLRIGVRLQNRVQFLADLMKYSNALRRFGAPRPTPHAVLVRAVSMIRSGHCVSGHTRVALLTSMGLSSTCSMRHRWRRLTQAAHLAAQVGLGLIVGQLRVRAISAALACGRARYEDKLFIRSLAMEVADHRSPAQLDVAYELASTFVYYGYQDATESLLSACLTCHGDSPITREIRGLAIIGRLMFLEDPYPLLQSDSAQHTTSAELEEFLFTFSIADYSNAVPAYEYLVCPHDQAPRYATRYGALAERALAATEPNWGTALLALAIALWMPAPYDASQWDGIRSLLNELPLPLPVALEWQRLLVESRSHFMGGDWQRAQQLHDAATDQLGLLTRPEHGLQGASAYGRWANIWGKPAAVSADQPVQGEATREVQSVPQTSTHTLPPSWCSCLRASADCPRVVAVSTHFRELQYLAECIADRATSTPLVLQPSATLNQLPSSPPKRMIIVCPDLWSQLYIRDVAAWLLRNAPGPEYVVTMLVSPPTRFRSGSPEASLLMGSVDGLLFSLAPISDNVDLRPVLFQNALGLRGVNGKVQDDVRRDVLGYNWPGGLAEIEAVAASLARGAPGAPIDARALRNGGWSLRVRRFDGLTDSRDSRVLERLSTVGDQSISELRDVTQIPVRTLLRRLDDLMARALVGKTGRGRATRYRLLVAIDSRVS